MLRNGDLNAIKSQNDVRMKVIFNQILNNKVYAPGRYLVGPFNHFIEFPGSLQTIEFSTRKGAKGNSF
jgi:hypothetical protein